MPAPSTSLATLRPDLAGSFNEFEIDQAENGFVANRVLPVFDTMKASGTFGRIPLEQLLQNRETARAPGAGYSRGKFDFTTDTFATQEHGLEEAIDDRESQLYADYFVSEQVAAARARNDVMIAQEKRAAALLFNATTWTGAALTTAVGTEWSTVATAVPITDVAAAVAKVYDGSGLWPNALIISRKVFLNLINCAQIIDRMKAQNFQDVRAGAINEQSLAVVFNLNQVIVAGGTKNSATEGQTATPAQIWSGEYAMVARVSTTQDIREPCVGRTFHWSQDGSQIGGTMETYRDETVRGDVVRVRHDVQEKRLYTEAAHLLSNITA